MLQFNDDSEKAKLALLHYAHRLNNPLVISLVTEAVEVKDLTEACSLVAFYWDMLDASIDDQPLGIDVLGDANLQGLMSELFNIFSDYLNSQNYANAWDAVDSNIS